MPQNVTVARWGMVAILLCLSGVVRGHPAPFSYLDLYLDATHTRGTLVIHDFDAAHELGLSQPSALLDPAQAARDRERLTAVIAARLHVTADTHPVNLRWGAPEVLADRQSLRLPFELTSYLPGRLEIDAWLFPYDSSHQSFINIYEGDRLRHQAILDAGHRTLVYYSGSLQGQWAAAQRFVQAGIHHILIGPDHVLFLLGLLLLGGSWRRLTGIVTAFTVGHSLTLSLAALDVVHIASHVIEPVIALSIIVVGVDNLLMRPSPAPPTAVSFTPSGSRDLRPWLAGAFGLIHGFGFAAVLRELGLPGTALGWSLAAFNVGVEIGQLAIVIPAAGLLWRLRRYSQAAAARVVLFGSIAVILAGAWWFLQRLGFSV